MPGYRVIVPKPVSKQLLKLEAEARGHIISSLKVLEKAPHPHPGANIKELRSSAESFLRLRCGDHRIMYEINGHDVVLLGIVHRRDLERWTKRRR